MFSLIENTGATLEEVIAARYDHFYDWTEKIELVRTGYIAKKLETNSMDFDDLLVMTVRLFEELPTCSNSINRSSSTSSWTSIRTPTRSRAG